MTADTTLQTQADPVFYWASWPHNSNVYNSLTIQFFP